jgi:hypothetical protein
MMRFAVLAVCATACSRSQGATEQDLPGLVVEARKPEAPIDVARAAKDPDELSRAMARPYRQLLAAIGPHSAAVNTSVTVEEAGKPVSDLSDHAQIDNGSAGTYRAVYTNSADYGRETTYVQGKLYLRPRYQRWHLRDPESPDEPPELRDAYFQAVAAMWDLLAPGAEVRDAGQATASGLAGRKIEISLASDPRAPATESLSQRKWRETRHVEAVSGEVVLDAQHGVPLAVKLAGSIGFTRDGRKFTMKLALDSAVSGVGSAAMITPPTDSEVVATPERLREVDDRDYLLQGIAPPLRRNPDGTAVPPAPNLRGDPAAAKPDAGKTGAKPDAPKHKTQEGAKP